MELVFLSIALVLLWSAWTARHKWLRRRDERALTWSRLPLLEAEGRPTPIDVFLALGATPLALELLIRRDLLPEQPDALMASRALADEIRAFGGYGEFLREMRALMIELEDSSRLAALQRAMPSVRNPRMLQLGAAVVRPVGSELRADLDRLGDVGFDEWLDSVMRGGFRETVSTWWATREVRAARKEVKRALQQLALVTLADLDAERRERPSGPRPSGPSTPEEMPSLDAVLADRLAGRWTMLQRDAERIEAMLDDFDERKLACGSAVRALIVGAAELRRSQAQKEYDRIHALARRIRNLTAHRAGDAAGHLIYINREFLCARPSMAQRRALTLVEGALARLVDAANALPRDVRNR